MAAMDAEKVELYKVYVDDPDHRDVNNVVYIKADGPEEASKKASKVTGKKVIRIHAVTGPEAARVLANKNRYFDACAKYEVHTRDKNGSCRVDIVRAKDYIDAVKKARSR